MNTNPFMPPLAAVRHSLAGATDLRMHRVAACTKVGDCLVFAAGKAKESK